jgi:hypothetical protein
MTLTDDIRARMGDIVVLLTPIARGAGPLDKADTLAVLRLCLHKIESSLIDLQRDTQP